MTTKYNLRPRDSTTIRVQLKSEESSEIDETYTEGESARDYTESDSFIEHDSDDTSSSDSGSKVIVNLPKKSFKAKSPVTDDKGKESVDEAGGLEEDNECSESGDEDDEDDDGDDGDEGDEDDDGDEGGDVGVEDGESSEGSDFLDDSVDVEANYEMLLDGWSEKLTEQEIAQYQPLIERVKNKYIDFSKVLRANLLDKDKELALEQLLVAKQMLEEMNITSDYFHIQNKLGRKIELHEKYTMEQLQHYKEKEEELSKKINQTELRFEILDLEIEDAPKTAILKRFHHLEQLAPGEDEYAKHKEWIDYARSLPWNTYTELRVNSESTKEEKILFIDDILKRWDLKQGFVRNAKEEMILNLVDQISKKKEPGTTGLRPKILTLCGPPGTGKTLFMKSFADILELPIHWIDFSGATDPSIVRGHSFTYTGSQPGRIIKGAIEMKSMSGVIVLEEIDKIVQNHGSENKVENVLVSLLDRTRGEWIDDYLEFPFDISNYMFVATVNDPKLLSDPLRNRLHIIDFPAYNDEQKVCIAKQFEIPHALETRGIDAGTVIIPDEIIKYIIKKLEKEDGMRSLKRAVESIIQRANFYIQLDGAKNIKTQFEIDDFSIPFVINEKHVDRFLEHIKPTDQNWRKIYS